MVSSWTRNRGFSHDQRRNAPLCFAKKMAEWILSRGTVSRCYDTYRANLWNSLNPSLAVCSRPFSHASYSQWQNGARIRLFLPRCLDKGNRGFVYARNTAMTFCNAEKNTDTQSNFHTCITSHARVV